MRACNMFFFSFHRFRCCIRAAFGITIIIIIVVVVMCCFFYSSLCCVAFISNPSLYHLASVFMFKCVYINVKYVFFSSMMCFFFLSFTTLRTLASFLRCFFACSHIQLHGATGYLMWGLICLVKHANSSKGLFSLHCNNKANRGKRITNLACLFDSPSPFI